MNKYYKKYRQASAFNDGRYIAAQASKSSFSLSFVFDSRPKTDRATSRSGISRRTLSYFVASEATCRQLIVPAGLGDLT